MKKVRLYTLPSFVKKEQKADQAFWSKDVIIAALVVCLSLLDACTLYSIFDRLLYQSAMLSWVLTIGTAVALNFIPLVLARLFHNYRYHMNGVKLWMVISLVIVFFLLFTATFNLRWQTRDLQFSGAESIMIDTTGNNGGATATDSDSPEGIALTILLGIMPGITSAINLALGFINDDPVKRKYERLQVLLTDIKAHRAVLAAAREELDKDWDSILTAHDNLGLSAAQAQVHEGTNKAKALARFELAKLLGDPDSISSLTEPHLEEA